MDVQELAATAKSERKKRGWTQGDAAKAAGLSLRHYGDIERGQVENLSVETMNAVLRALRPGGRKGGAEEKERRLPSVSADVQDGYVRGHMPHAFVLTMAGREVLRIGFYLDAPADPAVIDGTATLDNNALTLRGKGKGQLEFDIEDDPAATGHEQSSER